MRRFLASGLALLLVLAALLGGAGCAGLGSGGGNGFGMVAKDHVPFYATGPGEAVPDRYLERGVRMRGLPGGPAGYLRVQLVSGETGFVRTGDVDEAPDPTVNP